MPRRPGIMFGSSKKAANPEPDENTHVVTCPNCDERFRVTLPKDDDE